MRIEEAEEEDFSIFLREDDLGLEDPIGDTTCEGQ